MWRNSTGTHPDIQSTAEALQKAMQRRIATADRFLKLQIHNANQLYEYELVEAGAVYEVACKLCNILLF